MMKKILNWLIKLILLLIIFPSFVIPEEVQNYNPCYSNNWETIRSVSKTGHQVVIYKTPNNYSITATNASCVSVKEFLSSTNNLPQKMIVGLISEDGRNAFLTKWSVKENYLMLIEVSIPPNEYIGEGSFTMYPDPLKRIKDIMLAKKLPTSESLPLHLRNKFKTNYIETSVFQLKAILNGDF